MTPEHMVKALEKMYHEIVKYQESKPEYYHLMLSHLYDMCICSWLDLTQGRGMKGGDTLILLNLLHVTKVTARRLAR